MIAHRMVYCNPDDYEHIAEDYFKHGYILTDIIERTTYWTLVFELDKEC